MKNTSKLSLAAIAASLTLVGCGGGGTDAGAPSNLVSVSNAPIYNATVTDANGQLAYQVQGTYQYKFASAPTYPISASGGWMDVNLNKTFDAGTDVNLGYTMVSYSTTITPVTTYIADANESIREARLQELSDEFNISTEILLDIPVELAVSEEAQRLAILAASLTEEQVVKGSMDLTAVSTTFNDTVSSYTFDNTDMTTFITALEDTVITPLVTNGDLTVADTSSNVSSVVAAVEGNALEIAISSTDIQRVFFGRNRTVNMHSTDYQASDWRDQYSDWSYDESTGNILIHMSPSETVTIHFDVLPVIEGTVDSSSIVQNGKGSITIPGEGTFDFTVETGYVGLWGDRSNFDFNATTLEGKSLTFAPNTNDIYTMSITSFVKQIAFTSATEAAVVIVGDTGALDEVTVGWELINGNIVRIDPRDGGEYIYLEIIDNDAFEVFGYFYMTGDMGMDAPVYSGIGSFNPIETTTSTATTTTGTTDTTGTTTGTTTTTDTTGTTTGTTTTTDTTGTTTGTTTTTTDTTTKDFLAGKTFYLSDAEGRESLTFSADMTTVTLTDLNTGDSFPISITISGDTITDAYGTTRVDMSSLTTDTITIYSTDNPTGQEAPETWYLNQEARLRGLLANSTWASQMVNLTFNADVTGVSVLDAGSATPFPDNVTLNGMTLTSSDGTDLIIIEDDATLIFNPGTSYAEIFILQ